MLVLSCGARLACGAAREAQPHMTVSSDDTKLPSPHEHEHSRHQDRPACCHGEAVHDHDCTTDHYHGAHHNHAHHEHSPHGCCGAAVHVEGEAAAHMLHAVQVRNDWLRRAMQDAEEADRASGVWDTDAIRAELPPPPTFVARADADALIVGLRGRSDLNGQIGTLLQWLPAKERWAVAVRAERVLIRLTNLRSAVPARVLQDDDLLAQIFGALPAEELLMCAEAGKQWRVAARRDELWLPHRREQRRARVPWSPLTTKLEAEIRGAEGFASWMAEYARATQVESEGLCGRLVWTRGAHGEADWPGVVMSQVLQAGRDAQVMLVGMDDCCALTRPIGWQAGLARWRQRGGSHLAADESEEYTHARNLAVRKIVDAVRDGDIDVDVVRPLERRGRQEGGQCQDELAWHNEMVRLGWRWD